MKQQNKQTEDDKLQKEREAVLGQIAALAAAYTPEWRFNTIHPDAGTALALIFGDLFCDTRKRFAQLPVKHQYAFFNQLGLTPCPALAADGYAVFGLSSDEFGGAFLPEGVSVSAESGPNTSAENLHSTISYATTETLYVSPAKLSCALLVDGTKDYIALKDTSKPFSPFAMEEDNLQEHCFYLCHGEVLRISENAEVLLAFKFPGADSAPEPITFAESGKYSFSYSTSEGFEPFQSCRSENGMLVLGGLNPAKPPAPLPLYGREDYWLSCKCQKPWTEGPLCVKTIRVASRRTNIEPDSIWNQTGEQINTEFYPFGETPIPFCECYFASAESLGKVNAHITLSFQLDYDRITFDNSYTSERQWKLLMKRSDFKPDPEYDITIEQVVWEYYNGSGWSRLSTDKNQETMFNGRDIKSGTQVSLEFECPPDANLLEWQTAPTRYLRVRILRMKNLYKPKGAYIVPVLSTMRFCYDYGNAGKTPSFTVVRNNREEKFYRSLDAQGLPAALDLFYGQSSIPPALYLGFHLPLSNGPLRFLFSMQDELYGETAPLTFSYYGEHGFQPLSVIDTTENFKKSGTLTLAGKDDFVLHTICGETAYWLRITTDTKKYFTGAAHQQIPRINAIYLNVAHITAKEQQIKEIGGLAGNQKPGGLQKIEGSYGYVNSVVNPLPLCGGCDQETVEEALLRGSRNLRHRGRAVTVSDFEALACEASRAVKKVKCYSNCNRDGAYTPGCVALVLLLDGVEEEKMYFSEIQVKVTAYLAERMNGNLAALGHLYVVAPLFLELDCYVEAVVSDLEHIYTVQEHIKEQIRRFLHPLTGNYDGKGWNIGIIPNETQVINALKGIPGLLYIRRLYLLAYRKLNGRRIQIPIGGRDKNLYNSQDYDIIQRFAVSMPGNCYVSADTE